MPLWKRILVHGLMAAVPLALLGWLYAQMAGAWVAQSPRAAEAGAAVTDRLAERLPWTLALGGFLFVAVGEAILSLWRK